MNQLQDLSVELIDRNPDQPRSTFDPVTLAELAESIKTHGVIQPVEVEARPDGRYILHHGERRWRAAKLAGLPTIPAVIAAPQDGETLLVRGLLENLHREDLNPIDEARVFRGLLDAGWTRMRIARETGRSLPTVTCRLAWLELEPAIQRLVAVGHLPVDVRLANKLLGLTPEVRVSLAEKLAARAMSLQGCLAAVDRTVEKLAAPPPKRERYRAAAPHAHPVPMIRHGAPGIPADANGSAPRPGMAVREAAEAMCRVCNWRPKGDLVPSWILVEQAAAETCEACQKRDGPALPDVCRNCPGVALVKALVR